ncbi:MAG: alpha/beta hydrolase [Caulobacter sp.]|nr:alpha/beta hydrolase [Caulobacter sp.]
MNDPRLHRRALLTGAIGLGLGAVLAGPALAEPSEVVTLKSGERDVEVSVWRPSKGIRTEGVIVFSHGAGSWPARYDFLFKAWTAAGFLVAAPTHVDSMRHPKHTDYDLKAAFPLRLADLAAATAWTEKAAPGVPRASAGHSYGSLMSMMRGGALEQMIPARDPGTKAVMCFSSPGVLPGLMGPTAFSTLTAPLLMVTGDKDLVPGFVTDWRDHLRGFETSPAGDKHAWIGAGVDHTFSGAIGGEGKDPAQVAAFARAQAASTAFLRAAALGDAKARAALDATKSDAVAEFRSR